MPSKSHRFWFYFFGLLSLIYLSGFIFLAFKTWLDTGELRFNWVYLIGFISFTIWFLDMRKKPNLTNITLENINDKMYEVGFDKSFIEEVMMVLDKRFTNYDEQKFREWLSRLDYRLPEEFDNERSAVELYDKHSSLVEAQVKKLEEETKLTWGEQTVDLIRLDEKARKVQLVIRHRLTDIVLSLVY